MQTLKPLIRPNKNIIFKNNIYRVDFELIQRNSNYFYKNREDYNKYNDIEIFEVPQNITYSTFQEFISSCQNEPFTINQSNIIPLYYLSYKYDVSNLKILTNKFIEEHRDELLFKLISYKYDYIDKEPEDSYDVNYSIDFSEEEEKIRTNFFDYIKQEEFYELPINFLYRVINDENFKIGDENKIHEFVEFLLKSLDKYKGEASVLFSSINIENESEGIYLFNKIINEFNNIIDFGFIDPVFIFKISKAIYQENDRLKENIKKSNNEIKLLLKELEQMKKTCENRVQKIKEYENKEKIHQEENNLEVKNIIGKYKNKGKDLQEDIMKMYNIIKEYKSKEKTLQDENKEMNNIIEDYKRKEKDLQEKNEQLQENNQMMKANIDKYKMKEETLQDENKKMNNIIEDYKRKEKDLQEKNEQLQESNQMLEANIDEYENKEKNLQKNIKEMNNIIEDYKRKEKDLQEKNKQLEKSNQMMKENIDKYKMKEETLQYENKEMNNIIEDYKRKEKDLQEKNEQLQESNQMLEANIDEYENKEKNLQNNIKEMNNIIEKYIIIEKDLQEKNKQLEKSNQMMKANIDEYENRKSMTKMQIVKNPFLEIQGNEENILMSEYNKLPLCKKHSILEKCIKNNNSKDNVFYKNDFLEAFENLISYLERNDMQNNPSIHILYQDNNQFCDIKKENQVSILSDSIEILFKNKTLNTEEMNKIIRKFDTINIEMRHPQAFFDEIYKDVIQMKNKHKEKMNITIFITGIDKTDNHFKKKENIHSCILDKTICEIIGDKNGGSFYKCSSLTQITIPSSVASIGNYAFSECSSLIQITFTNPSFVNLIGDYGFCRCSSLTQISIPSSVTSIGSFAFNRCSSLIQITIPSSVTSIGDCVFSGCHKLNNILIFPCDEKRIEYIEDKFLIFKTKSSCEIFDTLVFMKPTENNAIIPSFIKIIKTGAFYGCSSLTRVTIPSSVTSIGSSAFRECSSLTQISVPSSVTSIGNYAFYKCSSLAQITFANPSSVTSIGRETFCKCSSFTQISIPSSVTSIGDYAFKGCYSLSQISIPSSIKRKNLGIPSRTKIALI